VLVLGDFNDDLDQSITAGFTITSYHSFMNDPNFYAPTLALSLAGKKSTVSYNDMIDHVIITDDLVPYYMSNSANVLNDVANLVSNYGSTTTDHYPVFTRYRFPNTVSPTSASCTEAVTFCASTTGTYTIPAFVASDDCDEILTYSYTITGATSRTGNSSDASGAFNTGTSVITWTASDSWGNTVNCVTTVTINANPTVTIPDAYALPSGVLPNTVYIGYAPASSITLTANAGGGAPGYTYSWTSGSLSASTTVSPLTNTTYTVTVTDQNNCQAMASKLITVMDIRGGHNLNKTIICHKPSQLNNTIVVNPADVANHLAHGDMLGACNAGASQLVTLGKETKEPLACLTVQAIPNPSNSAFALRIAGSGSHGMVTVKVTDMLGRLIETRTGIAADQVIRLGENYKPGFYMAAVSQGEETISVRLLKTR
jgi:hypothetical protein